MTGQRETDRMKMKVISRGLLLLSANRNVKVTNGSQWEPVGAKVLLLRQAHILCINPSREGWLYTRTPAYHFHSSEIKDRYRVGCTEAPVKNRDSTATLSPMPPFPSTASGLTRHSEA